MRFLVLLAILLAIFLSYCWIVRPYLRSKPYLIGFWAWLDAVETKLWASSRAILLARLSYLGAFIVWLHDNALPYFAGVDLTPMIPPNWQVYIPLLIPLLAFLFEIVRRFTTGPIEGAR
jgi:hypothetical protein